MIKKKKTNLLIFLIEDDEKTIQTIKLALENEGLGVKVAKDGKEALGILKENKIKPDLIILDLVLPRLNGFAILKVLRQRQSKIPVVVFSNLGQNGNIKRALSLGAKDYLVKSQLSLKEIVEKVKKELN